MSIKIGVYDFFSHIIPGSVYLFIFTYLGTYLGFFHVDINTFNSLTIYSIVVLAFLAYIIGLIFDQFARLISHLFRSNNLAKMVLDDFRN